MAAKKLAKQAKQYIDKNPIETFKDLGEDIVHNATDQGKEAINDLWDQLLGVKASKETSKLAESAGDLEEGKELNLKQLKKNESQAYVEPAIDYRREVIRGETIPSRQNNQEVEAKVQEIVVELKKLVATSKELQIEFKDVAVEQRMENVGKYHVNFFEWVLSVVKIARMKVEDSANWLATFKSKKNKKQYWNMFKKHGTSFGMSNERTVATQTG